LVDNQKFQFPFLHRLDLTLPEIFLLNCVHNFYQHQNLPSR
jgi:hypothetical protein